MNPNLPRFVISLATLAVLLTSGCYDSADLCGDNQVLDDEAGLCRCVDGAIRTDGECQMCGDGEVVVDNACECDEGKLRDGNGACVDIPPGQGMACADASECVDPGNPACHDDGDGGYCTTDGCTDSSDCGGGYTCATWEEAPYCQRPPSGMGESCGGQDDCSGYDADVCFPITSECVTEGCSESLDDCPVGYLCCDVSSIDPSVTTLCIPESAAGLCPANQ